MPPARIRPLLFSCLGLLACQSAQVTGIESFNLDSSDNGRIEILTIKSIPERSRSAPVLPGRSTEAIVSGLDALQAADFAPLRGKRFGLLTNATGLSHELEPGIDLLMRAGLRPEILFEPEHGIFGAEDIVGAEGIRVDPSTGLRIFSLYSSQRRPPLHVLADLDYLVVDIQNLPLRCYTYISTLSYVMEAAEAAGTRIMILDRPNPFGFLRARGPYPKEYLRSFIGHAPVPFLYSLTTGEYAHFAAHELHKNLKVTIVRVGSYKRDDGDAALRSSWVNPSPNIPSLESALVYTGMVFFEGTNVSLGRGTTRPFIYSGAPWIRAQEVAAEMRKLKLPGVQIAPVVFTPTSSLYPGLPCKGIQIHPVSLDFDPIRTGYELMRIIRRLHPGQFAFNGSSAGFLTDRLWGSEGYRTAVMEDQPFEAFERTWIRDGEHFEEWMKSYRLY
jgi:uncharacterized protein YbbC (DUF1343 family)